MSKSSLNLRDTIFSLMQDYAGLINARISFLEIASRGCEISILRLRGV